MSVEGRRPRHKPDGDSHNGSAADSDSARGSSILSSPTTPQQRSCCGFFFPGCSAVGSALGSGPRGRGFESRHSDHKKLFHRLVKELFVFHGVTGFEQPALATAGHKRSQSPSHYHYANPHCMFVKRLCFRAALNA